MPAGHNHPADSTAPKATIVLGASAIVVATVAVPSVHDRTLAEGYLTQTMVMSRFAVSRTYVTRRIGSLAPFFEVSTQRPRAIVRPTVFEPADFYGAERLWSFAVGVRLGYGMKHARMGRYGAAVFQHMHATAEDHSTMDME